MNIVKGTKFDILLIRQLNLLDFVSGFLNRQPFLSSRKPRAVSLNIEYGLNKTSVEKYFNLLTNLLEKQTSASKNIQL